MLVLILFTSLSGPPEIGIIQADQVEVSSHDLKISSDNASWNLQERTAVFNGNVIVTRGNLELTCGRLEVRLSDSEELEFAVATESVFFKQILPEVKREGFAQKADLEVSKGLLTLTGEPSLIQGKRKISGLKMVLSLDNEQLDCTQCLLTIE